MLQLIRAGIGDGFQADGGQIDLFFGERTLLAPPAAWVAGGLGQKIVWERSLTAMTARPRRGFVKQYAIGVGDASYKGVCSGILWLRLEIGSAWRPTSMERCGAWYCFADRYDANYLAKNFLCEREIVENWFDSRAANLISRSRSDCDRL